MVVGQRDHPVTPSPNIMGRRWGPSAPPAEILVMFLTASLPERQEVNGDAGAQHPRL